MADAADPSHPTFPVHVNAADWEQASQLLRAFAEAAANCDSYTLSTGNAWNKQHTAPIAAATPEVQRVVAILAAHLLCQAATEHFHRMREAHRQHQQTGNVSSYRPAENYYSRRSSLPALLNELFRKQLPFQEGDFQGLVQYYRNLAELEIQWINVGLLLQNIRDFAASHTISIPLQGELRKLRESVQKRASKAEHRAAVVCIDSLLGDISHPLLEPADACADVILSDLAMCKTPQRGKWERILAHAANCEASKPTKKWLAQAKVVIAGVDEATLAEHVTRWLESGAAAGRRQWDAPSPYHVNPNQVLVDRNASVLKGLVWLCLAAPRLAWARPLGILAESCFKKVRNHGPRNTRVGNACMFVLSELNSPDCLAQLTRLRLTIKHASARRMLDKSLNNAADRAGLSTDDLEELAVPTFNLTLGQRQVTLGEYVASLIVRSARDVELSWQTVAGKSRKSVPAAVRSGFASQLKELQQATKDIEKMLPAQRNRLERCFLTDRSWTVQHWRERYLDHPLLSVIARRLIWQLEGGGRTATAILHHDQLVSAAGESLDGIAADATVRLWHPLTSPTAEVLQWRQFLMRYEIIQPFKQAHREIYVLTDAERATQTYSNRFAAHLLKQHQFTALCKERGWRYGLQGNWDSHNVPTIELPQRDLRVEFWVDGVAAENETSGAGIYVYVSTDQVRFCNSAGVPQALELVPEVVFSELMRDVDLFVGVCSVGNDPNWQNRGEGQWNDYWQSQAFGELSASAESRRELLSQLLPKLKIASRCSLAGRFLIVRGDVRTYKIHLGSGNILMEPNDQYLCIVPDRGSAVGKNGGRIYLPFEGDSILTVILSKAFLLAGDSRITDPAILAQINRS